MCKTCKNIYHHPSSSPPRTLPTRVVKDVNSMQEYFNTTNKLYSAVQRSTSTLVVVQLEGYSNNTIPIASLCI